MIGNASFVQLRDSAAKVINKNNGLTFAPINHYFTLQLGIVTDVTVPDSSVKTWIAFFEYTLGADVWVSNSQTVLLTSPTNTVTETAAQLRPPVREVNPGDIIQLLYSETVFAGSTVGVGISYYPAPINF